MNIRYTVTQGEIEREWAGVARHDPDGDTLARDMRAKVRQARGAFPEFAGVVAGVVFVATFLLA